jgi:hypothetical protein
MKLISSNGGAYLIMAKEDLPKWQGAKDAEVYESIPLGADEGLIYEVNKIPMIVLGMPENLHACKVKDGALFVTIVSCDNDKSIPDILNNLPNKNWTSIGLFSTNGDLTVFDSSLAGEELSENDCFNLDLPADEYEAFSQVLSKDTYELQLLQLKIKKPAQSKQSTLATKEGSKK